MDQIRSGFRHPSVLKEVHLYSKRTNEKMRPEIRKIWTMRQNFFSVVYESRTSVSSEQYFTKPRCIPKE